MGQHLSELDAREGAHQAPGLRPHDLAQARLRSGHVPRVPFADLVEVGVGFFVADSPGIGFGQRGGGHGAPCGCGGACATRRRRRRRRTTTTSRRSRTMGTATASGGGADHGSRAAFCISRAGASSSGAGGRVCGSPPSRAPGLRRSAVCARNTGDLMGEPRLDSMRRAGCTAGRLLCAPWIVHGGGIARAQSSRRAASGDTVNLYCERRRAAVPFCSGREGSKLCRKKAASGAV